MTIWKYTSRLPWWLRPWGAFRSQRRGLIAAHVNEAHQARIINEQDIRIDSLMAEIRRLRLGSGEGMPSTGEPDFVIVGVQRPAGMGVRVIASRKLAGVKFDMTAFDDPPPRWVIRATMAQALFVDKLSYGEAIEHIGGIWANWDGDGAPGWQARPHGIAPHVAIGRSGNYPAKMIESPKEDSNAADQGN